MTVFRDVLRGLAAAALVLQAASPAPAADTFALLTADQTATLGAHVASGTQDLEQVRLRELEALGQTRSIALRRADGPGIDVTSPSGFALRSPIDFDVRFRPRDGVDVDMGSIRIDYRLGPIWANVTNRLARHASVTQNRLQATGAELPAGDHLIRLRIRDARQRETLALISFTVVE